MTIECISILKHQVMLLNATILKWLFEDYKMVDQYVSIYTLILKNSIES